MAQIISVTEAARNFSDVINRVHYQGQTFLLTRGGNIVARITAADTSLTGAEFLQMWENRPKLEPEDAEEWERDLNASKSSLVIAEDDAWDS
jgi:antitoxin (DNA-binding transcriptional repressor) of toxin-antitoxin stability system